MNESFTYLGKDFNFGMDYTAIKLSLKDKVLNYFLKIDLLPLHPKNKLLILQRYVFSKIKWQFSMYQLTETWVKQNIDDFIINKYIRKWLCMPISANVTHLSLPAKYLGLDIISAKQTYLQCQLSVNRIIKSTSNAETKRLYEING